eukprot:ANDGO_01487.mRNA.1 Guanine nucleotide exchange factor SPIKE 1
MSFDSLQQKLIEDCSSAGPVFRLPEESEVYRIEYNYGYLQSPAPASDSLLDYREDRLLMSRLSKFFNVPRRKLEFLHYKESADSRENAFMHAFPLAHAENSEQLPGAPFTLKYSYGNSDSKRYRLFSIDITDLNPVFLSRFGELHNVHADVAVFDMQLGKRITTWKTFPLEGSCSGYLCSVDVCLPYEYTDSLFVVLTLCKPLVGTDSIHVNAFSHPDEISDSDVQRFRSILNCVTCNGQNHWFSQPLCWSFAPLTPGVYARDVWMLFKDCLDYQDSGFLQEMHKFSNSPVSISSEVAIPVSSTLFVSQVESHNPFPVSDRSLFVLQEEVAPHLSWSVLRHHMHVSPISADFSAWDLKGNVRNIVVSLCLQADDATFPGKGSNEWLSHCSYHCRNPQFHGEASLQLPGCPNPKHHLLFRFFHVNCKTDNPKLSDEDRITLVGVAFLPLLDGSGNISSGVFELPVVKSGFAESTYLSPTSMSRYRWLDDARPCFKVRLNAFSSIYPSDCVLRSILSSSTSQQFDMAGFSSLSKFETISHFNVVADHLILAWKDPKGLELLMKICVLLPKYILESYVDFWFDESKWDTQFLDQFLLNVKMLLRKSKDAQPSCVSEKGLVFLMHLMQKLVILIPNCVMLSAFPDCLRLISEYYCRSELCVENLFRLMYSALVSNLNAVDRWIGIVRSVISAFSNTTLCLSFCCRIFTTPFVFALSLPRPFALDVDPQSWLSMCFLSGCVLGRILELVQSSSISVKTEAIACLYKCVSFLELRIASLPSQFQNSVSQMLYPILNCLLSNYHVLETILQADLLMQVVLVCVRVFGFMDDRLLSHVFFNQKVDMTAVLKICQRACATFVCGKFDKHLPENEAPVFHSRIEADLMQMKTAVSSQEIANSQDLGAGIISLSCVLQRFSVLFLKHHLQVQGKISAPWLSILLALVNSARNCDTCTQSIVCLNGIVDFMAQGKFDVDYHVSEDMYSTLIWNSCSPSANVQNAATTCWFSLLQYHFSIFDSFDASLSQMTWSISHVASFLNADSLTSAILRLQTIQLSELDPGFVSEFNTLASRVDEIAKNAIDVHRAISAKHSVPWDVEEVFVRTIESLGHAPDQLAIWLDNLSYHHLERGNYAEAAQAVLSICRMIMLFMQGAPRNSDPSHESFIRYFEQCLSNLCCPWETQRNQDLWVKISATHPESLRFVGIFQNTPETLIPFLHRAAAYFEKENVFEFSFALQKLVVLIYEARCELNFAPSILSSMITTADAVNPRLPRFLATYYRLTMVRRGELGKWETENDFIVKFSKVVRVGEFKSMLTAMYPDRTIFTARYDSFLDVPSSFSGSLALYISTIQPLYSTTKRNASYANGSVSSFLIEQSFTRKPDGTADFAHPYSSDLSGQWRMKFTLYPETSFPSVKCRLRICRISEEVMDPVENSCDIVRSRIEALRAVSVEPPDVNALQLALQGSVMAAVNGGILEIVKAFLQKPGTSFDAVKLAALRSQLDSFFVVCENALRLENRVCPAENRGLHEVLQQSFVDLLEAYKRIGRT